MMPLRNFILSIFVLITLTNCNNQSGQTSSTKSSSLSKSGLEGNSEIGNWKYDNTIWYSAELTLHDNGTFIFHNQSCYGQRFTEGHWRKNNGAVVMSSFDKFKILGESDKQKSVKIQDSLKEMSQTFDFQSRFADVKKYVPTIIHTSSDTIAIYFDKVQMKLTNDTLYGYTQNEYIANRKFSRTKNNR